MRRNRMKRLFFAIILTVLMGVPVLASAKATSSSTAPLPPRPLSYAVGKHVRQIMIKIQVDVRKGKLSQGQAFQLKQQVLSIQRQAKGAGPTQINQIQD